MSHLEILAWRRYLPLELFQTRKATRDFTTSDLVEIFRDGHSRKKKDLFAPKTAKNIPLDSMDDRSESQLGAFDRGKYNLSEDVPRDFFRFCV